MREDLFYNVFILSKCNTFIMKRSASFSLNSLTRLLTVIGLSTLWLYCLVEAGEKNFHSFLAAAKAEGLALIHGTIHGLLTLLRRPSLIHSQHSLILLSQFFSQTQSPQLYQQG